MSPEAETRFIITGHYDPSFEPRFIAFYRWKIESKHFIAVSTCEYPTKNNAERGVIEVAKSLGIQEALILYEETPNPEFII